MAGLAPGAAAAPRFAAESTGAAGQFAVGGRPEQPTGAAGGFAFDRRGRNSDRESGRDQGRNHHRRDRRSARHCRGRGLAVRAEGAGNWQRDARRCERCCDAAGPADHGGRDTAASGAGRRSRHPARRCDRPRDSSHGSSPFACSFHDDGNLCHRGAGSRQGRPVPIGATRPGNGAQWSAVGFRHQFLQRSHGRSGRSIVTPCQSRRPCRTTPSGGPARPARSRDDDCRHHRCDDPPAGEFRHSVRDTGEQQRRQPFRAAAPARPAGTARSGDRGATAAATESDPVSSPDSDPDPGPDSGPGRRAAQVRARGLRQARLHRARGVHGRAVRAATLSQLGGVRPGP